MSHPTQHLLDAIARLNRVDPRALAVRHVRELTDHAQFNAAVAVIAANDPDGPETEVYYNRRDLHEINRRYIPRRLYGLTGPSLLEALLERLQTAYHLKTLDADEVELIDVRQPKLQEPQYWRATLRARATARIWRGETELWVEYDPEAHLRDLDVEISVTELSGLQYAF